MPFLFRSEEYNCMNLMVVGAYARGKTSLLQQLARWGTCPKEKTVSLIYENSFGMHESKIDLQKYVIST